MWITRPTAIVAALITAATASAQDRPIEFRLAGATTNPVGCMSMDSSLTRVHTVTLNGDTAIIKSAGGIDDKLKQTSPGIYKTVFSMGGVRLDVVADATSTPRTLTVVEAQRGCKWNAIAP